MGQEESLPISSEECYRRSQTYEMMAETESDEGGIGAAWNSYVNWKKAEEYRQRGDELKEIERKGKEESLQRKQIPIIAPNNTKVHIIPSNNPQSNMHLAHNAVNQICSKKVQNVCINSFNGLINSYSNGMVMSHENRLNVHDCILKQHGRQLINHKNRLNVHDCILKQHRRQLINHENRLNQHDMILNEYGQRLSIHENRLNQQDNILSIHHQAIEIMNLRMDGMEIELENQQKEIKELERETFFQGLKINRMGKIINDHEERINENEIRTKRLEEMFKLEVAITKVNSEIIAQHQNYIMDIYKRYGLMDQRIRKNERMIEEMGETINKVIGYSVETRTIVNELIKDSVDKRNVLIMHDEKIQEINYHMNRVLKEVYEQHLILNELVDVVNVQSEKIENIYKYLEEINNKLEIHDNMLKNHENRIIALETYNSDAQKEIRKTIKTTKKFLKYY